MPLAILQFGGVGSQEITQVEQAQFTKPMQIQIWPCVEGLNTSKMVLADRLHRRAEHGDNGACISSPRPVATQLVLSMYVSGAS